MHGQPTSRYLLSLFLLCLTLAGCGASVGKNVKVSEENMAKYDSLSAEETVAAFEQRLNQARQADMPFLAPNYFREAEKLLHDTQALLAKKPRKAEVIGQVAKGDALLDKGLGIMESVRISFARELELKGWLDKFSAATVYPKDYENVMEDLSDLMEKVELGKADKMDKDKAELIKAMEALDIKTVQYAALHDSEMIYQSTRDNGGEKQAPATLGEALRAHQDALQRIAAAPHDEAAVQQAGDDAMFAALHARHINERVQSLQKQYKTPVEAIVLEEENRLLAIAKSLGQKDLRAEPLDKQAAIIEGAAGNLLLGKDARQQAESQLVGANAKIKGLEQRLTETEDARRQDGERLQAKEREVNTLNTRITLLEKENQFLGQQLSAQPPVAEPAPPATEAEPAAGPVEASEAAPEGTDPAPVESPSPEPAEPTAEAATPAPTEAMAPENSTEEPPSPQPSP